MGLAGRVNTYAYVGDPLTWVDPLRLSKCSILASKMVKSVNGRMPINSKFAGNILPLESLPLEIRNKYPHIVLFNSAGFPDFTRYSINNVRI